MGIGIPASGKTTILREFAQKYGYDYIGLDDLRLEIYGKIEYETSTENEDWKQRNKETWKEVKKRIQESLLNDNTVVLDATFSTKEKREEFLDFLRENGAEKVQGIYVDTPVDVAKERNEKRKRRVPEEIVNKIVNDFEKEPLKIEEGFDGIFTVDEYQNLVQAEISRGEGSLKKEFK